jgi:hypothetical protein
MNTKRIVLAVSIIVAVGVSGHATGTPTPGSLQINGGSGGTSASSTFTDWDPLRQEYYTWTHPESMPWAPGMIGASSTTELASASLTASFASWNMSPDGWVEFGNTAIISGSATRQDPNVSAAQSWASISFTNTTFFLFSARVTGSGSVSLRGGASFDIVNGQSLDIWLWPGYYSIVLDATDNGSFFATIPAPGALALAAASAMLCTRRRRAIG